MQRWQGERRKGRQRRVSGHATFAKPRQSETILRAKKNKEPMKGQQKNVSPGDAYGHEAGEVGVIPWAVESLHGVPW